MGDEPNRPGGRPWGFGDLRPTGSRRPRRIGFSSWPRRLLSEHELDALAGRRTWTDIHNGSAHTDTAVVELQERVQATLTGTPH